MEQTHAMNRPPQTFILRKFDPLLIFFGEKLLNRIFQLKTIDVLRRMACTASYGFNIKGLEVCV